MPGRILPEELQEEVDIAIAVTRLCVELHCLPGPGGLLDQDSYWVYVMSAAIDAQHERDRIMHAKTQQQ